MARLDLDAIDWDCRYGWGWTWKLQIGTARYGWVVCGCYRLKLPGMAGAGPECYRLGLPGLAGDGFGCYRLGAARYGCGWTWMSKAGTAR
jgi:hypothetical protein